MEGYKRLNDVQVLMDLITSHNKFYCLKAVLDLSLPDILEDAGGELTVGETASKLSSTTVNVGYLSRIMTFAALCGIFNLVPDSGSGDPDVEGRKFAMNSISKMMLRGKTTQREATNWMLRNTFLEPWESLGEATLTNTNPFKLGMGINLFEYAMKNLEWGNGFHQVMENTTAYFSPAMLKDYGGFEGLKSKVVVDVGGGVGATMAIVSHQYPGMRCINFDQEHVIARAPEIPGVEHVAGDMFKSVPEADAIILQRILHDWTDEQCILILKNCWKALPKDGKVIIIDKVLPSPSEASIEDYSMDIMMLAFTDGHERTERQWRKVLSATGFQALNLIPGSFLSVLECQKS